MTPEQVEREWDKFEDSFYAKATREELIENLKQVGSYNRYLIRISGDILADKLAIDRERGEDKKEIEYQKGLKEQAYKREDDLKSTLCRARVALGGAIDLAKDGWRYASDYFRERWDYEGEIKKLEQALSSLSPCAHEEERDRLREAVEYKTTMNLVCPLCEKWHSGINDPNRHHPKCLMAGKVFNAEEYCLDILRMMTDKKGKEGK